MKKGRFLGEKERDAIAVQHRQDTLYLMMRTLAAEAEELAPTAQHALSGEDLLYLSSEVMDLFLEMDNPHEELAVSEASAIWLQVKQRLREESAMQEDELKAAATLVVLSARECLRRGDLWRYWDVCEALASDVANRDSDGWEHLQPVVGDLWQSEDAARRYAVWWQQYTMTEGWLSDELAALLLDVRRTAPRTPDIEYKAEIIEGLLPFFKGNHVQAERFLINIVNKSDLDVIAEINRLKRNNLILLDRKVTSLHKLLSDPKYGLYSSSRVNFSNQVKD